MALRCLARWLGSGAAVSPFDGGRCRRPIPKPDEFVQTDRQADRRPRQGISRGGTRAGADRGPRPGHHRTLRGPAPQARRQRTDRPAGCPGRSRRSSPRDRPCSTCSRASQDENVRAAAILSLGKLGDAGRSAACWSNRWRHGSKAEQAAARRSLIEISGESINQTLAADLLSASPDVQAALIEVLADAAGQRPVAGASWPRRSTTTSRCAARPWRRSARSAVPSKSPRCCRACSRPAKASERDAAEKNVALVCERIENDGPARRGADRGPEHGRRRPARPVACRCWDASAARS